MVAIPFPLVQKIIVQYIMGKNPGRGKYCCRKSEHMSQPLLLGSKQTSSPLQLRKTPTGVRFRGGLTDAANTSVDWLMRNLYDRGEGVRYAVEQTAGYTLPRIYQQWNRTRSVTGAGNPMAAMEMGIREFAADFADTFLPGLLATLVIGPLLDRTCNTLIRKNMGAQALTFYEALLTKPAQTPGSHTPHPETHRSQDEFFDAIGRCLADYARQQAGPDTHIPELSLAKHMHALNNLKDIPAIIQRLAGELRLPHPDVTLSHTAPSATHPTGKPHTLDISLSDLLRDLYELKMAPGARNGAPTGALQTGAPKSPDWGRWMAGTLSRTRRLMPHQLWGVLIAMTASGSIPFVTRLITRHYYGKDSFPGTKELHDHFAQKNKKKEAEQRATQPAPILPSPIQLQPSTPYFQGPQSDPDAAQKKKFVWFPYLTECVKKGQWLPPLLSGAFFAVLGGAVLRRFRIQNLSPLQPSHWLKVYEFSRGFPFTTVAQMELTYGLLCGTRLLSSRDDSEFRETGIRDCVMGWPTLTYGFDVMKKLLGTSFNKRLGRAFGNEALPLLMKNPSEVRSGEEIAEHFFRNTAIPTGKIPEALQQTRLAHRWVTFASAVTNWFLLALAEPQIGIWLTNRIELNKFKRKNQEGTSSPLPSPPPSAHPLPVSTQASAMPIPSHTGPYPANPGMGTPRFQPGGGQATVQGFPFPASTPLSTTHAPSFPVSNLFAPSRPFSSPQPQIRMAQAQTTPVTHDPGSWGLPG
jgi:hypothetical protein